MLRAGRQEAGDRKMREVLQEQGGKSVETKELLKEMKQAEIAGALFRGAFETESGWYNGHYRKNDAGEWGRDAFPIPVISVKGLCDIEIQFDEIAVSTTLKRDIALAYSFEKVADFSFEAYGVTDYYHKGQTVQELRENIRACDETEIGFFFCFSFEECGERILELVGLFGRKTFYN